MQNRLQGVMQGEQGTVGHTAACGDGANSGHIHIPLGLQWGRGAEQGVVPTACGSRVAPLPRDRDKGHLRPLWGGSGLEGWC